MLCLFFIFAMFFSCSISVDPSNTPIDPPETPDERPLWTQTLKVGVSQNIVDYFGSLEGAENYVDQVLSLVNHNFIVEKRFQGKMNFIQKEAFVYPTEDWSDARWKIW